LLVTTDARADLARWLRAAFAGASTIEEATPYIAPNALESAGAERVLAGLRAVGQERDVEAVIEGPLPGSLLVSFAASGEAPAGGVECAIDDEGRLFGFGPAPAGVDVRVEESATLSAASRDALFELFTLTYDQADPEYLERSLSRLRFVAIAGAPDGEVVGFSLGDRRDLDLPQVGRTPALLAGLGCVHPDRRRAGVFRYLANVSLRAAGPLPDVPVPLGAGRMAHPASMRTMAAVPSRVPQAGVRPTELQQQVGMIVADAYGVASFDPETFVCRGSGKPIGFPRMHQDVEPHEWDVFAPVDRSRGDSLLALIWQGPAPEGW
jgi:GNAT superfamily N-acetyltransferase